MHPLSRPVVSTTAAMLWHSAQDLYLLHAQKQILKGAGHAVERADSGLMSVEHVGLSQYSVHITVLVML